LPTFLPGTIGLLRVQAIGVHPAPHCMLAACRAEFHHQGAQRFQVLSFQGGAQLQRRSRSVTQYHTEGIESYDELCSLLDRRTHGPHASKRSATDWSVMDSYRAVKVPATSRKGLSKPQYKKTTRKSCAGVLTFLARTKALNSRAICAVSGGRSCKSSSKSVSGSVRGNCMGCFSCGREGHMFPPCSMPSVPTIYSLSWRLWAA